MTIHADQREIIGDAVATAWRISAPALAAWAQEHLVNRTDVWGLYVRWTDDKGVEHGSMTAPAIKQRGSVSLTQADLERHFCGVKGQIKGVHSTSTDNTCKWFGFDFDNHHHDPAVAVRNFEQAQLLVEYLRDYGFVTFLEDSNGDGGYHVWVLLSAPAPSIVVYTFALQVVTELGLAAEVFPKQAEVGTGYGNFLRMPGKHHSRDHWSRICLGRGWLEGQDAIDAILDAPVNDSALLPEPTAKEELDQTQAITRELSILQLPERRKDSEIALDCLQHLGAGCADDRAEWIKVGQILFDIDPNLLSEWDAWSQQSTKYKTNECASKWKGFGRRTGRTLTLGTLVYLARRAGAKIRFYDSSSVQYSSSKNIAQPSEDHAGPPIAALSPDYHIRPQVILPGGATPIIEAAGKLGPLLARTGELYVRGGALVSLAIDDTGEVILRTLKTASLPSAFEQVATLSKFNNDGALVPAICTEQCAKVISASDTFLAAMPPLKLLSPCPVLIERDEQLVEITGYDRASGIYALGDGIEQMPLERAVALLKGAVKDFHFATDSDRSRAMAAMITPALAFGGILGGRAPIDLGEADASQSGKGYRNRLTAAVYDAVVHTVTQKKGGVGSLEESFNTKLSRGAAFISIDNVRGSIDSPAIESFLTEDTYTARIPFQPAVEIDPRRVIVQFTSNRADITLDLANRSSCVRILKQRQDFHFTAYLEGDILDHIRAHQRRYLGAVFAVIRAWHARGKPRSAETRHDFRAWAKILDWIVRELLGQAPMLDGHRETQERMTNPAMNWLRDIALAVKRAGQLGCRLQASNLLDIAALDGTIEIPGVPEDTNVDADPGHKSALQGIGRRLGQCFKAAATVIIDGLQIERQVDFDHTAQRDIKSYIFTQTGAPESSPDGLQSTRDTSGESATQVNTPGAKTGFSPDGSPDEPPDFSPDISRVSPNTPDESYSRITGVGGRSILSVTDDQGSQGKTGSNGGTP